MFGQPVRSVRMALQSAKNSLLEPLLNRCTNSPAVALDAAKNEAPPQSLCPEPSAGLAKASLVQAYTCSGQTQEKEELSNLAKGEDVKGASWDKLIQPLGRGSFDNLAFVRAVVERGYAGPIGLQCYGISIPAEEHLEESLKVWRNIRRESILQLGTLALT